MKELRFEVFYVIVLINGIDYGNVSWMIFLNKLKVLWMRA